MIDTIQFSIHPLQHLRTPRHQQPTETKQHHPPRRTQDIKNRVRIPPIMPITQLDPKPIPKRKHRAHPQRLPEPDPPRRRTQQIIHREHDGGDGMETDIRQQAELEFGGDDEFLVDGHEGAVEGGDEDLERGREDGDAVFEAEERARGCEVGEGGEGEG